MTSFEILKYLYLGLLSEAEFYFRIEGPGSTKGCLLESRAKGVEMASVALGYEIKKEEK